MGIPHKAFYCKRIIFSLFVFMTLILVHTKAYAYDSIYVVEDVNVDVTANNSVEAQGKAFINAQGKAFSILTERMVSEKDVKTVRKPNADVIATMIDDFEVKNEQVSAVRYVGDFTFRFNERAVSQFFSVTGVQYTSKSSKPLLVLPILQVQGKNTIWSERNYWMQAWARARLSSGVVPVEVPIGDLDDIGDIDDNDALRYERQSLERMLMRYGAKEAAIMIAVPDPKLSGLAPEDTAKGRLRISIYRTDRGQAERVNDIVVEPENDETVAQLYDRSVYQGHRSLQRDWKNKTLSSAADGQTYHVRLLVGSINDLVRSKNMLSTLPGFGSLSVSSLKPVEAQLSFVFRGDEERLRAALSRTPFSLSEGYQPPKRFVNTVNAPSVMYDLYYKQKKTHNFYQSPQAEPAAGGSNLHTF